MAGKRPRRGFSPGSLLALLLTVAVGIGFALVLPRLQGDTRIQIDGSRILETLQFADGAPNLSLEKIPISVSTVAPTIPPAGATPAALVVSASTDAPEQQTEAPARHLRITWGGSVFLEKAVRQSGYYQDAKAYDFTEILSAVHDNARADLSVVSLHQLVMPDEKVSDLNAPGAVFPMLAAGGFDTVSLAFGQGYDRGASGVQSTLQAAGESGLRHLGLYQDAQDAGDRLLQVNGVPVALLQYIFSVSSRSTKLLKNENGADILPLAEIGRIRDDISRMQHSGAAVILVGIDWGTSAKSSPTKAQQTLCQQIAEAGADAIIGTGSQNVQSVVWLTGENGRQVLCAYGLGALLCASRKNAQVAGVLLHLDFEQAPDGSVRQAGVSYTPTYCWRYRLDGQYSYRVIPADQPAPDGIGDQEESLQRAAETIRKAVGEAIPPASAEQAEP